MPDAPVIINNNNRPSIFTWVLLGTVFILGAILFNTCRSKTELYNQNRHYSDSLAAVQKAVKDGHIQDSIHSRQVEYKTALATKGARDREDSLVRQIGIRDVRNQSLSNWINTHKPQPVDTLGWVLVPKDYPDSCSACATALKQSSRDIDSLNDAAKATEDLLYYEIRIREQRIATQDIEFNNCDRNFNALRVSDSVAMRKLKPRTQFYLGGEIIGGPQTIFQNVGAVISLKTKQDKLYQLSGGLMTTGNWYMRLNANFKISFHK